MEWDILADSVFLAFERYKDKSSSMDCRMVCFLLNGIDMLKSDHDKLQSINP